MKESNIISEMLKRIGTLETNLKDTLKKGNKKSQKEVKEDEEVCPECGGDLLFVEEGVVYCQKCKKYYENEEEE